MGRLINIMELVLPAQAGMILDELYCFVKIPCITRTGGDDPSALDRSVVLATYYPHRRG